MDEWALASFFGRMNYSYKDKYMALLCACSPKAVTPFSGKWYATQYGCRTEVTFNPDKTIALSSEANSQANMTMPYVATKQGDHFNFDFTMKWHSSFVR